MPISRRGFLILSAGALAARTLRAADPMSQVRIALMGLRIRGLQLARHFLQVPNIQITHLCDIDDSVIAPTMKIIEEAGRPTPQVTRDYRTILDDPSVDGLVVSTPDHWHALATVTACQAGKHVYVEKPISHNIVEGRLMVKVARRYNRVVQAGTQRRSSPTISELADFVQSGEIGPVHFVRAWITSKRENIGHAAEEPIPAGVDYDRWLGPSPYRAFNRNHFHYRWHWNWLYGTGELGNNGIHGLDLARQVLQLPPPMSVVSTGGKHFFDDDQNTPDTQWVSYQYPKLTLIWEHRTWSPRGMEGRDFGVEFHGEKGFVITDGVQWTHTPAGEAPTTIGPTPYEPAHQQNWIDSIRGDHRPHADIEIAHASTTLCHLGNIAYRVGQALTWDADNERFPHNDDANQLLSREYRPGWSIPVLS